MIKNFQIKCANFQDNSSCEIFSGTCISIHEKSANPDEATVHHKKKEIYKKKFKVNLIEKNKNNYDGNYKEDVFLI